VLFTSATALIAGLSKAEAEGKLGEQLSFLFEEVKRRVPGAK
jgi:hypothetical protein